MDRAKVRKTGPVLLTAFARQRKIEVWEYRVAEWRERAMRTVRSAERLASEAWLRGEHEVSKKWEAVQFHMLRYAERCRRALESKRP